MLTASQHRRPPGPDLPSPDLGGDTRPGPVLARRTGNCYRCGMLEPMDHIEDNAKRGPGAGGREAKSNLFGCLSIALIDVVGLAAIAYAVARIVSAVIRRAF